MVSFLTAEPLSVVTTEFVFDPSAFSSCHASTLLEMAPGEIACAWFGGTQEGASDVGIWLSFRRQGSWTVPKQVASGEGLPCWNPVLCRLGDETLLFYKVGKNPRTWTGALMRSQDNGRTWSKAEILPAGILGPIKNKPLVGKQGELICGSSVESCRSDCAWVEITHDKGKTWTKQGPIAFSEEDKGLIQPALYFDADDHLHMLCRGRRGVGSICSATSVDGLHWSTPVETKLPCPDAGFDIVRLKSGPLLLVYNHTAEDRSRIDIALSTDDGQTWSDPYTLEKVSAEGELSYPAVIQTEEGKVAILYTHNRSELCYKELEIHAR